MTDMKQQLLKKTWFESLEQHNFGIHNNLPTYYKPNVTPSCIDHVCSIDHVWRDTCQYI